MAKSSPEMLASALRANLKRRKGAPGAKSPAGPPAKASAAPETPPNPSGPEQG